MVQSIRNIISEINAAVSLKVNGGKFYGIAQSVEREGKVQPVVDERAVSFDDSYSMQIYHKVNNISVTYKGGYGDEESTINTFSVSAYVFNNEKRTGLKSDELAMLLQSVFASVKILSVRVRPVNAILNTPAIFATEYRGNDNRISDNFSLLQFNYNVEMTFKSGCFDLCPEDFTNCKTN